MRGIACASSRETLVLSENLASRFRAHKVALQTLLRHRYACRAVSECRSAAGKR